MRGARIALLGLGVTTAAWALVQGDRVYVRGRDVAVLQSTAPTASTLLKLQPGDSVVWRGADSKKPTWHKVEAKGKTGFVYYANLSPTPPATELLSSPQGARKVDAQAFASSGAAGKALTEGAIRYGNQDEKNKGELKPTMREAVRQTQTLESIAAQQTDAELEAQAKRIAGDQR
jgi:hypothetical protein